MTARPLVNLRAARERDGLSQTAAAALLGCSQSVYSKKERGALEFSAREALALCGRLRLDLGELLEVAPDLPAVQPATARALAGALDLGEMVMAERLAAAGT